MLKQWKLLVNGSWQIQLGTVHSFMVVPSRGHKRAHLWVDVELEEVVQVALTLRMEALVAVGVGRLGMEGEMLAVDAVAVVLRCLRIGSVG
jgi:hypothetical protein